MNPVQAERGKLRARQSDRLADAEVDIVRCRVHVLLLHGDLQDARIDVEQRRSPKARDERFGKIVAQIKEQIEKMESQGQAPDKKE